MVNQLATPGLGSLMARRWIAGLGQLLLALAGFLIIVGWMIQRFTNLARQIDDQPPLTTISPTLALWGAGLFAASWLWALVTSLALLRAAGTREAAPTDAVPPRMDQPPGPAR